MALYLCACTNEEAPPKQGFLACFYPKSALPEAVSEPHQVLVGNDEVRDSFFYLGLGLFYLLLRASHKAGSFLR